MASGALKQLASILSVLKKKKKNKREVTVVWVWAGKRETADPELAGGLAHRWEHAGHVDRRPSRPRRRARRSRNEWVLSAGRDVPHILVS